MAIEPHIWGRNKKPNAIKDLQMCLDNLLHSINFKVMVFSFISTLKTDLFLNFLAISFRASVSKLQRIGWGLRSAMR